MAWAQSPTSAPVVKRNSSAVGYKLGDKITIQQGDPGVPIGLLLALTTEPLYFDGVTTKYGFRGLLNGRI